MNRTQRCLGANSLNHADAVMVAHAANELAVAHLDGDPECPDQLRALIEVLREVGLADS